MHILKEGNSNTKKLAYTSLMHPILEYGAMCWILTGIIIVIGNLGAHSNGQKLENIPCK
jgi:hypothetical protein